LALIEAGAVRAMLHLDRVGRGEMMGDPARYSAFDRADWIIAAWEALVNLTAIEAGAEAASRCQVELAAADGLKSALDGVEALSRLQGTVLLNMTAHCKGLVAKKGALLDAITMAMRLGYDEYVQPPSKSAAKAASKRSPGKGRGTVSKELWIPLTLTLTLTLTLHYRRSFGSLP